METLEIWEFTDHHPSGIDVWYQLEKRGDELSLQSADPEFGIRRSKYSGDQVLGFLKYLIDRAGTRCPRGDVENELWKRAEVGILDTYLKTLRKLLNDDARFNRRPGVRGGRVIESLDGGDLRFVPKVTHTPVARIQKTTLLDPFSSVPPLDNFVDRADILDPLIQTLLSGSVSFEITAVEGMPGVGKTMLAIALCHDPRVRVAFHDGIIWLPVGSESTDTFEQRVEFICEQLNYRFENYSKEAYQTLLQDKSVLVVLDDVWRIEDVEPFRLSSRHTRLLFTTRNKEIAKALRITGNQEVGELRSPLDRRFLEYWSLRGGELPEPQASGILTECDGLALAISMIGAALREQPEDEWAHVLENLKTAKLNYIGARVADYKYETVHAAIKVSVDALPAADRLRYLSLAVLLEGMHAAIAVLQGLWTPDQDEVRRTLRLLADRSLARRDKDGLRIHDLQSKYLRGEHPFPKALAILHSAVRRSYHVISNYPEQFYSQMTGRLLDYGNQPGIGAFLDEVSANTPRPRLRPLRRALAGPDDSSRRVLLDRGGDPIAALVITADGKRAVAGGHGGLFVCDLIHDSPTRHSRAGQSVLELAVTADGKRALSGIDGALLSWDLQGDQPTRTLKGNRRHKGPVTSVAVTTDDRWAISGSEDHTLILWDLKERREPIVLQGHTDKVGTVLCTSDNKRAVSTSMDGTLIVWDLEGGKIVGVLAAHKSGVTCAALTRGGKRILSGSADGTLIVWSLEEFRPLMVREDKKTGVIGIALSADGRRAISSHSNDHALALWDLAGNREPRLLEGHDGPVFDLAISSDGKLAVSSSGRTVIAWDLESNAPPSILEGHTECVTSLALIERERSVLSGDAGGSIIMWDLDRRPLQRVRHKAGVSAIAITSDGRRAVSGSKDRTVIVWDRDDIRPVRVLGSHNAFVSCVAITPDGNCVISGSRDGELVLWNLIEDSAVVLSLGLEALSEALLPSTMQGGHEGAITAITLATDGKCAISGSDDHTLMVWDLQTNTRRFVLKGHEGSITSVAMTPDGNYAVSSSADHTLIVWNLDSKLPPRVLEGHEDSVTAVAVTPDGKYAVSGSSDRTLRVWDLQKDLRPRILEGHQDSVISAAVTPDGRYAVSGSNDRTFGIWDLQRPSPRRVLAGCWVPCVVVTADCKYALTGNWRKGNLAVVDLANGATIAEFSCDGDIGACAYAAGTVAVGDYRGEVHFLTLEDELRLPSLTRRS